MATRRKGPLEMDKSVELNARVPLDAKSLARTKEEQLDPESYLYGYNGMLVSNREEQKLYMLINQDATTEEASWKTLAPYDDSALQSRVATLEQAGGSADLAALTDEEIAALLPA